MNARRTLLCIGFAILGFSFAAAARADDWQPEKGFISLYNGKDLAGWCYDENDKFDAKTEASDGRYTAKGDTIVVNAARSRQRPTVAADVDHAEISRRLCAEAGIPRRGERR